jgi:hypothetical protein
MVVLCVDAPETLLDYWLILPAHTDYILFSTVSAECAASPTSAIGNLINLYAVLMLSKPSTHAAHNSATLTHSSRLETNYREVVF